MFEGFKKTKTKRYLDLPALFDRQPELLYKSPYINFLREFRLTRLDYNLQDLYHEAAREWGRLSRKERAEYRYTDIIRDIKRRRAKSSRSYQVKKQKRKKKNMTRQVRYRDKQRFYPFSAKKRKRSQRASQDKATKQLKKTFGDNMIKKSQRRPRKPRRKPYSRHTIRLKRKFADVTRHKRRRAVRRPRPRKR